MEHNHWTDSILIDIFGELLLLKKGMSKYFPTNNISGADNIFMLNFTEE